jgi:hypothetical protein
LILGIAATGRLVFERLRLDREIVALRPTAEALSAVARSADEARAALRAVAQARQTRRELLVQLYGVIGALPDSSYLTAVTVAPDGKGSVIGMARRPTEVLAALEEFGRIRAPRLDQSFGQLPIPSAPWIPFSIHFGQAAR